MGPYFSGVLISILCEERRYLLVSVRQPIPVTLHIEIDYFFEDFLGY